MITIDCQGLLATWNGEEWSASNKEFLEVLKNHVPELSISDYFAKQGLIVGTDVAALNSILFLKPKVIRNVPKPIHEEPDIIY